jgi:predicted DNA-binding transcriptional regulator AlpA
MLNNTLVLRPKTVCSELGISISTFWRLVKTGELKTIKLSIRCTGVLKSDLDAYLNR